MDVSSSSTPLSPNIGARFFWLTLVNGVPRTCQHHSLEDWMQEGYRARLA